MTITPKPRRRRFRFRLGWLLDVLLLVGVVMQIILSRSSRGLYDSIAPGMTYEQLSQLFGSPGEELGAFGWTDIAVSEDRETIMRMSPASRREWIIGDHKITVLFGTDGTMACKY